MKPLYTYLCLLAGFLLQLLALWWLLTGQLLVLALLAHLVGALAWGFGATMFLPLAQLGAWWLPAACAAIFPVVGLLVSCALAAILHRPPPDRAAARYTVWDEQPRDNWRETLPAGVTGQSIVEILQSPRTQLRRNAVLALRDLDPQMAIPLLRKGLQDSDEQVRIYAQNILSSMLERFESGIKELEQRLAAEPSAALPAVRLAEQYFELVYLDVAGDDETAAHYLGKALGLLERAAAVAPGDLTVAFLALRYALRARDVAAARRWCERLEQGQFDRASVLPWAMELAFLEGDWAQLQRLFAEFAATRYFNPRIEELARFWTGAKAA